MRITSVVQRYGNLVGFGELRTFKHLTHACTNQLALGILLSFLSFDKSLEA